MGKDDDRKKKRPYRDIDDFMEKFFEDMFERPLRLSDIFEEFDRMIRRFFGELNEMDKEFMMGEKKPKRYTWGLTIVIPPTGPPRVFRFGNVKASKEPKGKIEVKRTDEFEPLATVYEEDSKIRVIVDLPGVDEEKINIDATEKKVIVRAEGADRKYYKEIELPKKVDPKSVKASFRNGILELEFNIK